jgi:hypothetical protein
MDRGAFTHDKTSPRRHISDALGAPLTFVPHTTNASVGAEAVMDPVDDGPGTE